MRVFCCLAFDIVFLLCDYNYYNIYNYYKTITLHKDDIQVRSNLVAIAMKLTESYCSEFGSG